ncbi:glycoside hydrolase family 9 protein [Lysobacter sp. Root667]|uniref:glycoside hydrolase family 9 protein n=1 Tax=Lysobacter sp. Root667 TaxID=1736581 RepID=UPI0019107750|nr:glycoside hydrolase family 9 protein [Lysobacter sp. Root667]
MTYGKWSKAMTRRYLRGTVVLSVLLGMVTGLSACGDGGETSSPAAHASEARAGAVAATGAATAVATGVEAGAEGETGAGVGIEAAAVSATTPIRMTGGPLPPTLIDLVGNGPFIVVDQFGYLPSLKKVAVLRDPAIGFDSADQYVPGPTLQVVDVATNTVVFSGSPTPWKNGDIDASSGDRAWQFDFSAVTAAGTYEVVDAALNVRSARFEIGANVYRPVLVQAVRAFFYQRAGHAKLAQYAGTRWADSASHMGPLQDTQARRYNAAGDASTQRDLHGGWYDAGDFNKYTSWGAAYVVDLLHAYTENKSVWTDDFNLPESGNGVPDILDEVKWGLDWQVRMQNADGSVLSIVGLASAGGGGRPSAATGQSLYGDASTSATLASAAAYAYGAKVYASLNKPAYDAYAADLGQRAKRAWDWAMANPNVLFYNNDASRGTQGLGAGQQETDDKGRAQLRLVAAIYLYALTGDTAYRSYVESHYTEEQMFSSWWLSPYGAGVNRPLLYYASLPGATASVAQNIRTRYTELWERPDYAGWGAIAAQRDPYRAYLDGYVWGSNGIKALAGGMFADQGLYGLSQHSSAEIADAGAAYLHYLHGVNPLGKTYLSNMGAYGAENSVDQFFHSWFADGSPWDSVRDSQYGPAPGFLVGGANNTQYDWDERCPGISTRCGSARPSPPYGQPGQKAYKDFNDSWPLNSWPITENSNGYQAAYIRLLARYVK